MKNAFFLTLGLIVLIGSFYLVLQAPAPLRYQNLAVLNISDRSMIVELSDTEEERSKGLSGRSELASGRGMLFIFESADFHPFWMRDMLFAIDIVWIDANWRVVGVEEGVLPESFPQTFTPPEPAKYVLELNAGEAQSFSIDIGSEMSLDDRI